MANLQYSQLNYSHDSATDIPLSPIPSNSDARKMLNWQDTALTQDSISKPKSRTFLEAINGWWLELGSVALAFSVIVVTIVLLAYYNGKPLQDTPRSPNLSTLVNIFSTIEASLLVFVAAEVLSQSKWLRMQKNSLLDDFNIIDNASRGVRGSVQVLFKPWLGTMSLIGAVMTLLAVVIGPMLQETVVLRTAWAAVPNRNATVPISKFFAAPTNPQLPKLDVGMKGTILNGLSSANTSALTPIFGCPTGNCTYGAPYTSLGISHSCQRLEVTRQCNGRVCDYTLPNGHVLRNSPGASGLIGDSHFINVSTAFNLSDEVAIQANDVHDQLNVVRASIISLTNGPLCYTNGTNPDCILDNRDNATQARLFDGGAIGAYCDLALCTNTYTANVSDAVVSERLITSTDYRNTSLPKYEYPATDSLGFTRTNPALLPNECYIDGIAYALEDYKDSNNQSWTYVELEQWILGDNVSTPTRVPIECVFSMRTITYQSIFQFMLANPFFLDGSGISDSNTGVAGGLFSFVANSGPTGLYNLAAFGVEPIFNNGNASFETIEATFERLAGAMTTYMRDNSRHSRGSDFTGLEQQLAAVSPEAPGVLSRSITVVRVQWYWVILPLFCFVTTVAYLVAAIVQGGVKDTKGNMQANLWKSNILVPLVIGHQSRMSNSAEALDGYQAMQALKRRRMNLVSTKNGWVFIQNDGDDIG